MAPPLGHRRRRVPPRHRRGAGRVPDGAPVAREAQRMSGRLERLQELVAELEADALLVTNATNVLYLTGFASSNAAVLATADHVWLLTDGRYVEAARASGGGRGRSRGARSVRRSGPAAAGAGRRTRRLRGGARDGRPARAALGGGGDARADAEGGRAPPCREGGAGARGRPPLDEPAERGLRGPCRRACRRPNGGRARMVDGAGDPGAGSRGASASSRSWRAARTRRSRTITPATVSWARARRCSWTRERASTATAPTARGRSPRASCRRTWPAPTRYASTRNAARSTVSCPARAGWRSTRSRDRSCASRGTR